MDFRSILNDTTSSTNFSYHGNEWKGGRLGFLEWYKAAFHSINGYLCLTVCFLGIVANVANIIVLSRKKMKTSFNVILLALASADLVVLISAIAWIPNYSNLDYMANAMYSYPLTIIGFVTWYSLDVIQVVSVWLTVVLAVWRVMAVSFPHSTLTYLSLRRARIAIVTTYVAVILIHTPDYLHSKLKVNVTGGVEIFEDVYSDIYNENEFLFKSYDGWVLGVMVRVLPCVLLVGLTSALIRAIYKSNKSRRKLSLRCRRVKTHNRTTKMLIMVVIMFLFANVPSAIIYCIELTDDVYVVECVYSFSDTVVFLILCNSAFNFFVYMKMNLQFRENFVALFLKSYKIANGKTESNVQTEQESARSIRA